jgi:heme-degrading monooxygenase HmoA
MFVRMGTFAVAAGQLDELARVYATTCAPIVRHAEGNLDAYLLEPTVEGEPAIVCTLWRTEADAQRYESSGQAQEIVGMVRKYFAGPPVLRAYRVRRTDG